MIVYDVTESAATEALDDYHTSKVRSLCYYLLPTTSDLPPPISHLCLLPLTSYHLPPTSPPILPLVSCPLTPTSYLLLLTSALYLLPRTSRLLAI